MRLHPHGLRQDLCVPVEEDIEVTLCSLPLAFRVGRDLGLDADGDLRTVSGVGYRCEG